MSDIDLNPSIKLILFNLNRDSFKVFLNHKCKFLIKNIL